MVLFTHRMWIQKTSKGERNNIVYGVVYSKDSKGCEYWRLPRQNRIILRSLRHIDTHIYTPKYAVVVEKYKHAQLKVVKARTLEEDRCQLARRTERDHHPFPDSQRTGERAPHWSIPIPTACARGSCVWWQLVNLSKERVLEIWRYGEWKSSPWSKSGRGALRKLYMGGLLKRRQGCKYRRRAKQIGIKLGFTRTYIHT